MNDQPAQHQLLSKLRQHSQEFMTNFKALFLAGLLTILPITLTFWVFRALFRLLAGWLTPIKEWQPEFLKSFPYSELLIFVLLVLLIGLIARVLLLRPLVHFLRDRVLFRLPLIKPVYSGIKQLTHALIASHNQMGFHTVVTLEFPSAGLYSLGFLTGELPAALAPQPGIQYYRIYIPNSPNPVTGHFLILPATKFTVSPLSRHEAMAIIMSGGVVMVERFKG